MTNRRNVRLVRKKAAEQALGTSPHALAILRNLAEENPGQSLRTYIRSRCKEILSANLDRPELLIDVNEILALLTEAQLRKERLLKAKKDPKVPPFPVPSAFVGRFRWAYKFTRAGEITWQMIEA